MEAAEAREKLDAGACIRNTSWPRGSYLRRLYHGAQTDMVRVHLMPKGQGGRMSDRPWHDTVRGGGWEATSFAEEVAALQPASVDAVLVKDIPALLEKTVGVLVEIMRPAFRQIAQALINMPRCDNEGCSRIATRAGGRGVGGGGLHSEPLRCDEHGPQVAEMPIAEQLRALDGIVQLATRIESEWP